jgi:hypothetical protein
VKLKAALFACAFLSCDSDSVYLYLVNVYDPTNDCITGPEELDVEEGNAVDGSCGPLCIAGQNAIDGGIVVTVSTMCGPPPFGFDVSGSNALCQPALAALARSAYCLDGGGSSNPLDASDAGTD